jgi:hypothetical protein
MAHLHSRQVEPHDVATSLKFCHDALDDRLSTHSQVRQRSNINCEILNPSE